jgi:hypothetical protein
MARVERAVGTFRVDIVESERNWGQKIDEIIYFDNGSEAIEYVLDYNDEHNPPLEEGQGVPDWYMVAQFVGPVMEL